MPSAAKSDRSPDMMRGFAIIPAAGLSTRMGSTTSGQARKQLAEIAGAPILVPVRPEDKDLVAARVANEKLRIEVEVLEGGAARQDSVWNALQRLSSVQ